MQSGFENQIRTELLTEIDALEKDYGSIKDILSGVSFESTDVKGILHSFKDHLSKTASLFMLLSQMKAKSSLAIPIDNILRQIDLALTIMEFYPQQNPSGIIQTALTMSSERIENIMSIISILKKMI